MKRLQWCVAVLCLGACVSVAAAAERGLSLTDFERLKRDDRATLEVMLEAMYETAVYAQSSMDNPVLCFTPLPIAGGELIAMVEGEVTSPTGEPGRAYVGDDRLALILVAALKSQDVCR